MELKGRLKSIAEQVPDCNVLCDVGTDHAYIPIYSVLNGKARRAIAADVRKGPLAAAAENIRRLALTEHIETRMGDGLEILQPGEADTVVIAGMGGDLIREILEKGRDRLSASCTLILQPMNAIETLRKWLWAAGYAIFDETLAAEGEKLYNIFCCRWTGETVMLSDAQACIGSSLVEKRDPLLRRYVQKKLRQVKGILQDMQNAENDITGLKELYTVQQGRLEEILAVLDAES